MSRTVKSEWVVDYRGASDVGVTEWGARRQSKLKGGQGASETGAQAHFLTFFLSPDGVVSGWGLCKTRVRGNGREGSSGEEGLGALW